MSEVQQFLKAVPLLPDDPDTRDWVTASEEFLETLPQLTCSLGAYALPAFKQVYGSCAAHAATQMVWNITRQMPGMSGIKISPMDLYWRTRERMGRITEDSGSNMRRTMQALTNPGVVPWFVFPDGPSYKTRPPVDYKGPRFRIPGYLRIPADDRASGTIRHMIFNNRTPVLVGIRIPERIIKGSFGSKGLIAFSPQDENFDIKEPYYSHCMVLDGWLSEKHFEVLNSWGPTWGRQGRGIIHKDWFESPDTCIDMWTVDMSSNDLHGIK